MAHLLKMKTKEIKFRDPVVERVVDKFVSRSDVGYAKYGRTLHDERTGKHKDLAGYLNDIQEELMDAILYIQAAKEEHEFMKQQLNEKIVADAIEAADHAAFSNTAQLDWDDHVAPI